MAMLSPRTITPLVVVVLVLLLLLLLLLVVAVQNLAWRGHRRHPMPRAHATRDVGEGSRQGRNEVAGDHRRRVRLCHGCCPVTTRPPPPSLYRLIHTHIDTHADPGDHQPDAAQTPGRHAWSSWRHSCRATSRRNDSARRPSASLRSSQLEPRGSSGSRKHVSDSAGSAGTVENSGGRQRLESKPTNKRRHPNRNARRRRRPPRRHSRSP